MTVERLTEFLSVDHRGKHDFYIKQPVEGFYIRRPDKELEAYGQLRQYMPMPRARMAGTALVVEGIHAPSAEKLLTCSPDLVSHTLDDFVAENERMWRQTLKPMDETVVCRNWREESLKTALKLRDDPEFEHLSGLKLTVNGKDYPPLKETLDKIIDRLTTKREPIMVLTHGDEHLANIIPVSNKHVVIDPGNWTGMNTPSSVVNNLEGGNRLFFYTYRSEVRNGTRLEIDFSPDEKCNVAAHLMEPVLKHLEEVVDDIQDGDSLSRELLFVNCARVAMGWVQRSQDLTEVKRMGKAYLGVAVERYYEDRL